MQAAASDYNDGVIGSEFGAGLQLASESDENGGIDLMNGGVL
jgi:hypothetical protein